MQRQMVIWVASACHEVKRHEPVLIGVLYAP
jgi:hypothetical protein